jgi:hypothetical protein
VLTTDLPVEDKAEHAQGRNAGHDSLHKVVGVHLRSCIPRHW